MEVEMTGNYKRKKKAMKICQANKKFKNIAVAFFSFNFATNNKTKLKITRSRQGEISEAF
jgi:hypothetical protein